MNTPASYGKAYFDEKQSKARKDKMKKTQKQKSEFQREMEQHEDLWDSKPKNEQAESLAQYNKFLKDRKLLESYVEFKKRESKNAEKDKEFKDSMKRAREWIENATAPRRATTSSPRRSTPWCAPIRRPARKRCT